MDFDTITSISTPMGEGAIGIVRLSGPQAIEIGDILYKGKKKLSEVETHTINYGHIIDPETNETVEEVMVSVLRAPKTFTREDIIISSRVKVLGARNTDTMTSSTVSFVSGSII